MKITLNLTPAQAQQLYTLVKTTEVCDIASRKEQKCYMTMCNKVMESIKPTTSPIN